MGTSIDYSAVSHETIYQHITGGPGSMDLVDASRGWQSVAAKLTELHGTVEQAIRGIGAGQQGAAADAATNATMALMPWLADSVAAANAMAARISQQATSFGHTRDNMPPPVKVPEVAFNQDPATWLGEHAVEWLPGIQTEHERAQVAAQQAEQRARELMSGYQSTSNDNLAVGQQFGVAPTVVADVSSPVVGGAGVGGAALGGSAAQLAPHSGAAHPMSAQAAPAVTGHAAPAVPAGTAPQVVSDVPAAPATATTAQLAGSYSGPDGQAAGSGTVRPGAAAAFGSPAVLGGSGAVGGSQARGGSRGFGGGAGISRGGGFGPRPTPTFSEGHSITGSHGYSGNSGYDHAEPAGAGRGARAGSGWGSPPLGATGSSGQDRTTEHRRPSYLIEQDTNAIVGDLPRVAPPVIGED